MARHRAHLVWSVAVVAMLAMTDGAIGDARAQPSAQPPPAPIDAACPRPAHVCPPPVQMSTWVSLTLKPAGGVCRFDPQTIDSLRLHVGDDVSWDFCSECAADMDVQLDTTDANGPFDDFQQFTPPPLSDNEIHATVGCNGFGSIRGRNATSGGGWKYSMRVKPVGTATFPEVIDPRLEIDDYYRRGWILHLMALILGLVGGVFAARRLRRRPA